MTGFNAFWDAWPANSKTYSRKGAKAECAQKWAARFHDSQSEQIVKHVEWMKTTHAWLKDGGAYIPAPLVYLNQQRWDGAEIPEPSTKTDYEAWKEKADKWIPVDKRRVAELVARAKKGR